MHHLVFELLMLIFVPGASVGKILSKIPAIGKILTALQKVDKLLPDEAGLTENDIFFKTYE